MGGSLRGVLEHSCLCALDPHQRPADLEAVARLLAPGGWLLALFWCHSRPGGPPRGSDPAELARQRGATGLQQELWEPARGSAAGRDGEWLGCGRVGGGGEIQRQSKNPDRLQSKDHPPNALAASSRVTSSSHTAIPVSPPPDLHRPLPGPPKRRKAEDQSQEGRPWTAEASMDPHPAAEAA
ncbi:MAG: hypothetical protein ACK587_17250 [Cyanobacteriota bacterium]